MKHDIQVQYDVDCEWTSAPPRYRLYVNNELFTERTWIWKNQYLEETIPINAPAGDYVIRYEIVGNGRIEASNGKILNGPAEFIANNIVRIRNEAA